MTIFDFRFDFPAWTFAVLAESQNGLPIACDPVSAQDACDAAPDCDFYGNSPDEFNTDSADDDFLIYETTDPAQLAKFAIPTNQFVDLDWTTNGFVNTACSYSPGAPCHTGFGCIDVDTCDAAVFWKGKAYVEYCYDAGGGLEACQGAPTYIQFDHDEVLQQPTGQADWKNRAPRHGPKSAPDQPIVYTGARVQGAGSGLVRVKVYFDYFEGYYIAGAKNTYMDEDDSVDCDVTVTITDWWIRWKILLP